MHVRRLLTSLVLAVGAAGLTAGPALAAEVPNPDIRSYPNGPTCSGDVFGGVVRVSNTSATVYPATVEVRWNAGGRAFSSATASKPISVSKGNRDYAFSFDVAGLPANAKQVIAYTVVGSPSSPIDTLQSKVVQVVDCAPAEVVPEAPSALLIPLSLAATAGAVTVAMRRRQTSTVIPA
jgi:hypothetical protein